MRKDVLYFAPHLELEHSLLITVSIPTLSFIFAANASLGANGYGALSPLGTTTTLQVALIIEIILKVF